MRSLDFTEAFTERTPRIVKAAKLHRTAVRRKEGRFIVEGSNSVEAAVATGSATDVFVTAEAAKRFADIVVAAGHMQVFVHPITAGAARSLADTATAPGIFAVCRPVLWRVGEALGRSPRLVTVAVGTNDPGNAGTLVRVSDALGADAVIFAGDTVDPQSSKAVRASAGSVFHVPVARSRDVGEVLRLLKSRGLQLMATAADGEVDLGTANELLARPTAWLFGNEAHGLGPELMELADHRVAIPIKGSAESLNLATAASICLWESSK